MKLIVGLGNPDKKYENTFHNLGFLTIDKIAENYSVKVEKQACKALISSFSVGTEKVILAKPQTYMNLSGESVLDLLNYYKISPEDLMVIYDDYDLKKGAVRIRKSGSAGTHNGMRNIVNLIKTQEFKRVRIGFNPGNKNIELINYVLSGISAEDKKVLTPAIEKSANSAIAFIEGKDFDFIMRTYNYSGDDN